MNNKHSDVLTEILSLCQQHQYLTPSPTNHTGGTFYTGDRVSAVSPDARQGEKSTSEDFDFCKFVDFIKQKQGLNQYNFT